MILAQVKLCSKIVKKITVSTKIAGFQDSLWVLLGEEFLYANKNSSVDLLLARRNSEIVKFGQNWS